MDLGALCASFFIGIVGFALLGYGKKQQRVPHIAAGLALMLYPYFVGTLAPMIAIAVGIVGILWLGTQRGWF